jgi:hypothetical protein
MAKVSSSLEEICRHRGLRVIGRRKINRPWERFIAVPSAGTARSAIGAKANQPPRPCQSQWKGSEQPRRLPPVKPSWPAEQGPCPAQYPSGAFAPLAVGRFFKFRNQYRHGQGRQVRGCRVAVIIPKHQLKDLAAFVGCHLEVGRENLTIQHVLPSSVGKRALVVWRS